MQPALGQLGKDSNNNNNNNDNNRRALVVCHYTGSPVVQYDKLEHTIKL